METQSNQLKNYQALVIGATGGIGNGFVSILERDANCRNIFKLSRRDGFDLMDETSIKDAAETLKQQGPIDIIIDATGFLHDDVQHPEKAIRAIEPENMARAFALNATGPLLILKHFHGLLPFMERGVFATLSARVGSIEDNRLGGWYAYRMSKAALNMGLKTAAIEIARKRKLAICVALHPGTVETQLSDPFSSNRDRFTPEHSAEQMLNVLHGLAPTDNGSFFAYDGSVIPW
ncbi:MAG: SDR family NAD(P)-dependent oxidoreductase [Hyphomonadaceae bacterium]|nr:SDR family NAD(P)-dependent oxidoreductase [Hyphomonadaceae bacterium]